MVLSLKHPLKPDLTPEETARQRFVSGLRGFVLNDLAADMRKAYDGRAKARFEARAGRPVRDGRDVHAAMRGDPAFTCYSALRVAAQEMVWDSVAEATAREHDRLENEASRAVKPGQVTLADGFTPPRNVTAIDVHLMPGGYAGAEPTDLRPGALYDQGLAVFSMGLMGENLDDIGLSMAAYVSRKFPDFAPRRILDLGCTIGHNTLPWKQTYPEAEVIGIDAAAPGLRYGAARASLQGVDVAFAQMDASALDYPDESFDLVFSSMFLHELSQKTIAATLKEARRVLRPGGLMLHMELPPNTQMSPFESFYLDWDCYYNEEPFYKAYRDREPRDLCIEAGFESQDYLQFVVPSVGGYGLAAVEAAVAAESHQVDAETTGRLAEGITWFGFGAWKR
jgi:ubiquinone/menaquinone biosynthesis C-methylase UbiE